jgi:F-type H+-transporting ATPase subunit epsilon
MTETFQLEIATPAKLLVDEAVSSAEFPGANGYLGVLPDHAALLGRLQPGVLTYTVAAGKEHVLVVEDGFLEVLDNHVSVLIEQAEPAEKISLDSARRALAEAEQALMHPPENPDYDSLLRTVRLSQARVDGALKVHA